MKSQPVVVPDVDDPEWDAWFELAGRPEFLAWEREVYRIGACEHPVFVRGRTVVRDKDTGAVLRVFDGADQPGGVLMLPCGNRRASRCGPCSRVYQFDAFHMVKAGLSGGKGVPEEVASHPRVFVTLTAPSFGMVHRRVVSKDGAVERCNPRRKVRICGHGVRLACAARHGEDEALIGTPLCPECYDYAGAVLWNAGARKLWKVFTDDVRRVTLPRLAGVNRREFRAVASVAFVKVAEFQTRGQVHFHAVVRLDGPEGPGDAPPEWASAQMIESAVRESAERVSMRAPEGSAGVRRLVWGTEVDVQDVDEGTRVPGYVAKYATKGAECAGTVDYPLWCRACEGTGLLGACFTCGGTGLRVPLEELAVTEHARRMIETAWELGGQSAYRDLKLRRWAHQLGFGGHFSTKSRMYSVTLKQLRQARIDYRVAQRIKEGAAPLPEDAVKEADWEFAGSGWSGIQVEAARLVREDIAERREVARDGMSEVRAEDARMREIAESDPRYWQARDDGP